LIIKNFGNIFNLYEAWQWFNFLCVSLGKIAACEVGLFVDIKYSDLNYICGDDNFRLKKKRSIFNIYQGIFKNSLINIGIFNLILPVSSYTERESTYLNLEGRFRFSKIVIFNKIYIYSDSQIIQIFNYFSTDLIIVNSIIAKFLNFLFKLKFFIKFFDYDNCIFFFNTFTFYKRLYLISGFSENWNSKFNINLIILFFIFKLIFIKFLNSVFFRYINNYYTFDSYSKNSKILSVYSLKTYILNFN